MWRILDEKFPDKVVKAWNDNEIRLLVLLSLFLQIVLVITGNRRKYIIHTFLKFVVWLTYQSADWVATVALGTLSRRQILKENESKFSIMAFWAPFLLLHLGGPDTITAYAMADNELWLRHALGLLVQTGVAIYVFVSSWAGKSVNILALLMFLPGLIKYGERTWALYSASRGRFRKSMISVPDPGPNYAKFMGEYVARKAEGYRIWLGKAVDTPQAAHPPPTANTQIIPEAETFNDAFYFFKTFKKLFADLILSFQDKEDSQTFFTKNMSWDKAFAIIEVELGLIYDLFFTKVPLIYTSVGFCLRILSLSSIVSILTAFLIINKHQYPTPEIIITYFLSGGAVFLEIYAILIAASSDRMMVLLLDSKRISFLRYVKFKLVSFLVQIPQQPFPGAGAIFTLRSISELPESHEPRAPWFPRFVYKIGSFFRIFHAVPAKKRWSNTMGQYNFFSVSLNEKPPKWYKLQKVFGIHELLEKYRYSYNVNVPNGLKALVFWQLEERLALLNSGSTEQEDVKKLYSYRGDQLVLKELNCFGKNEEVEFDQSLLIWHIATELCYYKDFPEKSKLDKRSKHELRQWIYNYKVNKDSRTSSEQEMMLIMFKSEISKWLSEYMLYLLVCCPFMLPSGLGQTRYQDTLAEIYEFIEEHKSISISSEGRKKASIRLIHVNTNVRPSEVKGDRSKTVLFDGCRLAKALQNLGSSKWERIIQVWVDLLSYAAAQCRWNDHAEQLKEGGQLITHVWLLMAHFGMTDQFQISQGHVVAKWQVN